MCKIEKSGRGRPGRGDGFGNSDTPGQGEGRWFENPRFWRTSFVDGPLSLYTTSAVVYRRVRLAYSARASKGILHVHTAFATVFTKVYSKIRLAM